MNFLNKAFLLFVICSANNGLCMKLPKMCLRTENGDYNISHENVSQEPTENILKNLLTKKTSLYINYGEEKNKTELIKLIQEAFNNILISEEKEKKHVSFITAGLTTNMKKKVQENFAKKDLTKSIDFALGRDKNSKKKPHQIFLLSYEKLSDE